MTPQKIKLTRHDGSKCPVDPKALVFVQYNENQESDRVGGLADHRVWKDVLAYAVIELVEPDPVIEVGDVVVEDGEGTQINVIGVHGDMLWGTTGTKNYVCFPLADATLVRKGGAV